jgi:ribonuclease/clavin/mitogillin
MEGNVTIPIAESRAFLRRIGIEGEIMHTPGHSDDSVSLLLDDGSVFTGDLTHPMMIGEEGVAVVRASWRLLIDRGARHVYAGTDPFARCRARRSPVNAPISDP